MQSNAWNSRPFTASRQHSWPSSSSGHYNAQQTNQILMHDLQPGELNAAQRHQLPSCFEDASSGQIPSVMFTGPTRQLCYRNAPPNVTVHNTPLPPARSRNWTEHWHDNLNTPQHVPTEHRYTSGCTSSSTRFSFGRSNSNTSPVFEENNLVNGKMARSYPAQTMQHCTAQDQHVHLRTPIYQSHVKEVDNSVSYHFNSQPVVAHHRPVLSSPCISAPQQVRPHVFRSKSTSSLNTYLKPPPPYRASKNSVNPKPTVRDGSTRPPDNRTPPQILPQPALLNNIRTQQDTVSSRSSVTSYSNSRLLYSLLREDIRGLSEQDLSKMTIRNVGSRLGSSKKLPHQSSKDQTANQTADTRISHHTVPPAQSNCEVQRSDDLQQAAAQTRISKVFEGVVTRTDSSLPFRIEAVTSLEGRANEDDGLPIMTENVGTLERLTTHIDKTDANLPLRTEAVMTILSNNTDSVKESNALNLTEETSKDQLEPNTLENDSRCTSQSSTVSQDHDRAAQNYYGHSSLHYTAFEMADVPVFNVTLETLKQLVKKLEARNTDLEKHKATNVFKRIAELYWSGSINNMREQLKELTFCIRNASDFCVKDDQAVVLQHLKPKSLKLLKSQLMDNEATLPLPSEQFPSLWLNVDGPADIDKVLAEPLFDPILDVSCHINVSQSRYPSADTADNLDHSFGSRPENIPMNKPTSNDLSKDSCSVDIDGLQPESSAEVLIPATMPKNQQDDLDIEENEVLKLNDIHHEPGVGETEVGVDEEIFEHSDVSSDMMEVTLLSYSDVRDIFEDDLKSDRTEVSQLCRNERRSLPLLSDEHPEDGCQNVPSKVNFTCPHTADKTSGSDLFCPSCLGVTQVLTLDLDEEDSDVATSPRPVQCEDQNEPLSLKRFCPTEAAVSMPIVEISGNTCTPSNTNSQWVLESSEDRYSPQKIPTSPVFSFPTKPETISVSRNAFSKKADLSKTNANTNKQYLDNHRFTSYNENSPMKITIRLDQTMQGAYKVSKKMLAKRQQGANVFGSIHRMAAVPRKPKRKKRGMGTKQMGLNKGAKKVRFELFGSSKDPPSCESRERLASTPVILTISANANNSKGYSDSPSAKQKVFEQWSKTFVPTQQKGSRKKAQSMKSELKSRVQMLKIVVNDRMAFRKETQPRKRVINGAANDANAHQPKKRKSTSI